MNIKVAGEGIFEGVAGGEKKEIGNGVAGMAKCGRGAANNQPGESAASRPKKAKCMASSCARAYNGTPRAWRQSGWAKRNIIRR